MVKLSPPRPVKAIVRDESLTRSFGTEYQNLTGRPLQITVTATCFKNAADEVANMVALQGPTSPAAVTVAAAGFYARAGTAVQELNVQLTLTVPPGYYYLVNENHGATSSVTLVSWIEVEL